MRAAALPGAAAGGRDPGQEATASTTVPGAATTARAGLGTSRTGLEVAAGAPAEHRLGEQRAQAALEMAQLLGGETAVAALGQMLLHIRQQGSAPAYRDVEETVVEPAILGRREFPMGMYTTLAEFFPRLFESGRRGGGVHAEQTGGDGNRFGLDLGVPEQTAGESGQNLERTLGQFPVFGRHGLRRPHTAPAGRFPEVRQNTGYPVLGRPLTDGVADTHQKPRAQSGCLLAECQPVQDLVEGGRGHHGGDVRPGGETDDGVFVGGRPVPRHQQRGRLGRLAVRTTPEQGGEVVVGFPRNAAWRRVRRARGWGWALSGFLPTRG